jgi:2'-5' RNA ligase
VLAVGLEDRESTLTGLQAALSDALRAGGWYTPERRPYLGHVTVARVPAGQRVRAGELTSPRRLEFAATAVTLYRSRLERAGARYEALVRVQLP